MQLTGKCKEEFDKWYWKNEYTTQVGWDYLSDPMQIGVLILYFDSVGIIMEIQVHTEPTMQGAKFKKFRPEILANRIFNNVGASFGVRDRAWTQAIEKANEIREEQLDVNNLYI